MRGALEVDEDLRLQRRVWAFERAGWVVMALLVLAALLGVAGGGPLSLQTRASADGTVLVRYDRFARSEASVRLRAEVRGQPARGEEVALALGGTWADAVRLDQVTPQPQQVRGQDGEVVYVFAATGERFTVTFDGNVRGVGPAHGRLRAAGGEPVTFEQFLYP